VAGTEGIRIALSTNLEHDLATLRVLLDTPDRATVKGHAHYLLGLNAALRRSVRSRWTRDKTAWAPSDGLVTVTPGTQALEARQEPITRAAVIPCPRCSGSRAVPYQFLLSTIFRLEPWDEPEPLVRMDPLTRGSLFHKVQGGVLPGHGGQTRRCRWHTRGSLMRFGRLNSVLARVAAEYAEQLAPAIDRASGAMRLASSGAT